MADRSNTRRFLGILSAAALFGALSASGCDGAAPQPRYATVDRGGDTDGDGAPDADDACPNDAEDGLPPKANDGCPATDPDNDGILLADDKCPDAKEDGLPPSPADGCPMADTDGDGVADSKDKCPSQMEDNLAPEPSDGCPSADGDHDGIADINDKCPAQPETLNGYRDDDGCPDSPGGEVAYDSESSQIYVPETKKIDFDVDSAELLPAAKKTVTEVAGVLKAHPEIQRVEIEGHASSKGDAAYNIALTQKRALAVSNALQAEGVEAKRLVPIGYGEFCPAQDVGDNMDEPKNRRVLLKAVLVNGVWQSVPRGCWKAQTAGINPTKYLPGGGQKPPGSGSGGGTVVKPVGGA